MYDIKNVNKRGDMSKFIFLDRDGTIIRDQIQGFTSTIKDIEFLPKAIQGLGEMQSLEYKLLIVTNQAGISKKYYTEEAVRVFHEEIVRQLGNLKISVEKIYYCPHHPDITGECECRKPNPGMVHQAVRDFGLDPSQAIFIGDKDCDIELGRQFGAKTILISNGQYEVKAIPTAVAKDLMEAAKIIADWQS